MAPRRHARKSGLWSRLFKVRRTRAYFYNRNHLVRKQDGSKLRAGLKMKKRRVLKCRNSGFSNLHKRYHVDPVLRAIIDKPIVSRPEAVKLIWAYIKKNKLQKPENGRIILPDQRLGALTGEPGVEFNGFKLMTHIQRHFLQPALEKPTLFQRFSGAFFSS